MQTHKFTKTSSAHAVVRGAMDRSREEGLLLERWAASDSARAMDDPDSDESLDQFDSATLSAASSRSFDA